MARSIASSVAAVVSCALAAGCGGSSSLSDGGSTFFDAGFQHYDGASSDSGTLPPENGERRSFQTPQAGGRFVYVANPSRNTVAVIDSATLAIQTIEAGDGPTYLSTVPGRDQAVVVNVGSDDVTVMRTDAFGTHTANVPVARDANAVSIAPDGHHAVVWFDSTVPGATLTSGSFQDITVLTLQDGMDRGIDLSVGFQPLEVDFSSDGTSAFVITEDGISVLRFADLTGPAIIPNISLDDPTGAMSRNVSLTPDGHYALARTDGMNTIRLADLQAQSLTTLDVGSPVTDVEIAPDGSYALAVLRDEATVLQLPIPAGFHDASTIQRVTITGEVFGSVRIAPDGMHALLFTTATPVDRVLIMDLPTFANVQGVRLRKAVRAVAMSPDGRSALVVHTKSPGDPTQAGIDMQTMLDRSYGYSLVDLASGFAKLQLTPADVGPLAVVPDGSYAFVVLRDDAHMVRQVHRDSMRSFVVQPIDLGSPPLSVGIVPNTNRAFVGQDHPEGRITFIDWTNGALQSITGFELNSRVVM